MTDYSKLPTGLQGGIQRYIENGYPVGHFLTAVLSNDLLGAVSRADDKNIKLIPEIVKWLYNEAPGSCWGTVEQVQAWQGTVKEFTGRRSEASRIPNSESARNEWACQRAFYRKAGHVCSSCYDWRAS